MKTNWYRQRSLFVKPRKPEPPRKKWRVRYVLVNAIRRTCMVLGAMVLLSALFSMVLSAYLMSKLESPVLPEEMVLVLDLDQKLLEHKDVIGGYGYAFGREQLTIREVVGAIDNAARDPRVKGFVARLQPGAALNLAHLDEMRDAVMRFRSAGKHAYVYAPSYDTLGQYYLASAFEEIWLQPMGIVMVPGIMIEMPYARAVLDRIGVQPQIFAREEYKNFFESFTSMEMSPATREMMRSIVDDIAGRTINAIAAAREMDPAQVNGIIDTGLFTGDQALQSALIDRLNHIDVFNEHLKTVFTGDKDNDDKIFIRMGRYLKDMESRMVLSTPGGGRKKPRVALVYAVGTLVPGKGDGDHLSSGDKLAGYINKAAKDDDIDYIVLRIDSPGGSPVAAEAVRRAVIKAKEQGARVVVSMGESAASGGYWIAADADRIFAAPATLTGSIGVTGGKFSLKEMWGKIGVNWDTVQWGENAGLWSFNRPFTDSEAARMNALMDDIYGNFVSLVANGRGLTPEQVEKVAGGRVWTGAQAKELGLVDELGGLDKALDYAAQQLGRASRHELEISLMPAPKSSLERLLELLQGQVRMGAFLSVHADKFGKLGAALDALAAGGAPPVSGGFTASAPEWGPVR